MTVTQQACSISEPTETFPSSMLILGANVHMHTSPMRSWWVHLADEEGHWNTSFSQNKTKLTSHGVEAASSSHSQDWPRPWEHPSHRPSGWCSFGRDRFMLDFRQGQLLEAQRLALCLPLPTAHLYGACGLDRLLVTVNIFLQVCMLRHGPRMDMRDQWESPRPGSQWERNSYPRVNKHPSLR